MRLLVAATVAVAITAAGCGGDQPVADGPENADSPPDDAGAEASYSGGAGRPVSELYPPACHDVEQHGALLAAVGNRAAAPAAQSSLATISPGTYVVTAITEYGVTTPTKASKERTTVVFTATKQYYVNETADGTTRRLTFEWKISNGMIERTLRCASSGTGTVYTARIDASPNGFTVFSEGSARTLASRYERFTK